MIKLDGDVVLARQILQAVLRISGEEDEQHLSSFLLSALMLSLAFAVNLNRDVCRCAGIGTEAARVVSNPVHQEVRAAAFEHPPVAAPPPTKLTSDPQRHL